MSANSKRTNVSSHELTQLEERIRCHTEGRWPDSTADRLRMLAESFGHLAEAAAGQDKLGIYFEAGRCGVVLADLLALNGDSLTGAMATSIDLEERMPSR